MKTLLRHVPHILVTLLCAVALGWIQSAPEDSEEKLGLSAILFIGLLGPPLMVLTWGGEGGPFANLATRVATVVIFGVTALVGAGVGHLLYLVLHR